MRHDAGVRVELCSRPVHGSQAVCARPRAQRELKRPCGHIQCAGQQALPLVEIQSFPGGKIPEFAADQMSGLLRPVVGVAVCPLSATVQNKFVLASLHFHSCGHGMITCYDYVLIHKQDRLELPTWKENAAAWKDWRSINHVMRGASPQQPQPSAFATMLGELCFGDATHEGAMPLATEMPLILQEL